MNLICPKCGEVLVDGAEHGDAAACLASMKELLRRVRKSLAAAAYDVADCRAKKHGGRKVLYPLNLCIRCLGAGYAGYQVSHEIITTGRIPTSVEVKL